MSWQYRVFHTRWEVPGAEPEDSFTIREAYYGNHDRDDPNGKPHSIAASKGGSAPAGKTVCELMKDLAWMQAAFRRPVLTPADIPGYQYDVYEVPLDPPAVGGRA